MLSLVRLRVLAEVINRGSFSEAADALSYTQSAVSQAVARLERETGARLVVRDRRRVRPTAAGATLLQHADAIFAQVQAAEDELAALLGLRAGRLRVASFPSAGATLMPEAVATFRRRHPHVELSLAEGEPEEISPRLRSGEFDLALLFRFPGATEATEGPLAITHLFDDPMQVALPAGHRLVDKEPLALADLQDEEWVQTSAASPCARHVVRSCLAAGFEPRVSFESDDYATVLGLVAAGVGVALIPQLALGSQQPGVVVRPLDPSTPTRSIVAAIPAGPSAAPAARSMVRILADIAAAHRDSTQAPVA
jgi:DNA-binding transcriptional LysR family regulator